MLAVLKDPFALTKHSFHISTFISMYSLLLYLTSKNYLYSCYPCSSLFKPASSFKTVSAFFLTPSKLLLFTLPSHYQSSTLSGLYIIWLSRLFLSFLSTSLTLHVLLSPYCLLLSLPFLTFIHTTHVLSHASSFSSFRYLL